MMTRRARLVQQRAEPLPADAAAAFRPHKLRCVPTYTRYQAAISRTIPLVRLEAFDRG
jgi:hypothetical protein